MKAAADVKAEKKKAKEERRAKKRADGTGGDASEAMDVDGAAEGTTEKKEKKDKRKTGRKARMLAATGKVFPRKRRRGSIAKALPMAVLCQ